MRQTGAIANSRGRLPGPTSALLAPLLAFFLLTLPAAAQYDPLPSWSDGPAKRAIIEFVAATTDAAGPDFVPEAERIATFDQDGTLWVEQPMYVEVLYVISRVPAVVAARPELAGEEPFRTALTGDAGAVFALGWDEMAKLFAAALSGMSVEAFRDEARAFIETAEHPRWKRPYPQLAYQPMQEVLAHFRAGGYRTYIVTGSAQDFTRAYSAATYGIEPYQVIGTADATFYSYAADGEPVLTKEPREILFDDETGKPEGIHLMIGERPRAAFGNSTGDRQMLEYTMAGDGRRLAMLVLHDDAEREYAYGPAQGLPDSRIGTFTQALHDEATGMGWHVISMKADWRRVFAFEE